MALRVVYAVTLAALLLPPIAAAQSADEKAIRDLIAKLGAGEQVEQTANFVMFTGAYNRPFVRGESKEPARAAGVENRVPGTQRARRRCGGSSCHSPTIWPTSSAMPR